MSSGALFPTLVPGSRGSSSKYLVEFRAGKMSLKGSTVTPDKRKGLVYIQQTDDSLIHFCWKDRTSGNVEDDLIIFPDDCEFKRVPQCTTGRVFVLKFKAGSKRLFFWMQEPKTEKDEEHCRKVNEYLNNPPMPGALGGSGSGGHELSALGGEGGLQSLLGNMSHNQLMQLIGPTGLGGLGQTTVKPTSFPPSPPPPAITLQDFTQIMRQSFQQPIEQEIKKSMQKIREELVSLRNEMRENLLTMRQALAVYIDRLDRRVDSAVEHTEKLKTRVISVEQRIDRTENKIDRTEDEVTISQYRDTEFALRIRGLKENPKENLEVEVAKAVAPILQCDPEELVKEMDKTFRVNSWIARQKNLPRDVVIYFSRRSIRNAIIQTFYQQRFQIANQDIIILKEIPPKILRKRKDFAFLAEELKNRQVRFRWVIPVGIVVNYAGTRYRLNTISEAKDFYTNVLKAGSPPSHRLKRSEERQEDKQLEGAVALPVEESLLADSSEQSLVLKEDPKVQRMTRAAHRRKEKEQKQKAESGPSIQEVVSSEPVGGARPKRPTDDLRALFQRLGFTRDGKAPDMEC